MLALPRGTFHALAWGDPAAPPLIWLHGFPDHPPTAAPFLGRLAGARRVIAPWLRGYAPSPLAGPYDLDTLAADALRHHRPRRGPDRRGRSRRPRLGRRDHLPRLRQRPSACGAPSRWRCRTCWRSCARSATCPRSAGGAGTCCCSSCRARRLAGARDLALIDRLWRAWSPGLVLDEPRRAELHACLAASLPAPLGYYRAMVRPLSGLRRRVAGGWRPIATPLLQLHGEEDGCILPRV